MLFLAVFVLRARGQIYGVTNGNSFALINSTSQAGMFNWTVDGVNQLYQQWFWFRIGTRGGESSIDTLGAPTVTAAGSGLLSTIYANSKLSVQVDYALHGGAAGSGSADMAETITLRNVSNGLLDLHFFQYSDFDLLGNAPNDHVELFRNGSSGPFTGALQWDGDANNSQFSAHITVTGANHAEATYWPVLLNELTDSKPTTLADTVGVVGSGGDVDCAFQWDLSIAAGGSVTLEIDKNLTLPPLVVPEPSAAALAAMGLVGAAFLRRRRI
jgi:MYXO-CTERM domain-containing protein